MSKSANPVSIEQLAEAVKGKVIESITACEPSAVGEHGIDIVVADPEDETKTNTISIYEFSSTGNKLYLWNE